MAILSRNEAVTALVLPFEDVPVPELGAEAVIRVQCLTALDHDKYEVGFWTADAEGKPTYSAEGARGRLLALACIAEDGTPLFTVDEATVLRGDVADRLFDVAQRISGLNAKVEELKKAFGAARAGASRTT